MEAQLTPGTVVGGDFRVVSLLARGGMGAVYVAEQISTARPRALKLLRRDLLASPGMAERFTLEARVAARIRSDHVVEVIGAGYDPHLAAPWLAMELLEGRSLDAILAARGRLSLPEASEVLRQIGAGLAAAHQAGVVHRDLKPENVFLAAQRDASRALRVKILDFGIAKVLAEASLASPATVAVGTPRWMSPEQTESTGAVSPASDVWSFGLLAYAVITGRYFWRAATAAGGGTITQLLREVLADPIPLASMRAGEQGMPGALPPGFDAWLARCLERDPRRRFPNAGEAVQALGPILGPGHLDVGMLLGAAPSPSPFGGSVPQTLASHTSAPVVTGPIIATPPPRRPAGRGGLVAGLAIGGTVALAAAGLGVAHFAFDAFSLKTVVAPPIAPLPPTPVLDGTWSITAAATPQGNAYQGLVEIAPLGAAKRVGWTLHTGEKQEGVGLVEPGHFDVAWGVIPYAIAVYTLSGSALQGRFLEAGAPFEIHSEDLTGPANLEGTFTIARSSSGHGGTVTFTRDGGRLLVQRATTTGGARGVGLREGNRVAVAFSPTGTGAGIVSYVIDPGDRSMRGLWSVSATPAPGREALQLLAPPPASPAAPPAPPLLAPR